VSQGGGGAGRYTDRTSASSLALNRSAKHGGAWVYLCFGGDSVSVGGGSLGGHVIVCHVWSCLVHTQ
jgi:hypothetical protein